MLHKTKPNLEDGDKMTDFKYAFKATFWQKQQQKLALIHTHTQHKP